MREKSLIFHVDIDAFFASVEQVMNPALRERPVIVGNGCIASCSYEARAFGLKAGMSLREAVKLCPEVVILDGSEKIYRCFSRKVFDLCLEVAPAIETYLDEAYLDMSGTQSLYGSPYGPAGWIRKRIREETGLTVSVGIGKNRMFSKIATKTVKPDGLRWVRPEEEEAFLVNLPVESVPGVGPRTSSRLKALNVKTAGDLRKIPEDDLKAMFGKVGLELYRRCRGEDSRAIGKREIPRTLSRETTFHKETSDQKEIEGMIHYLAERAMRTLRGLGLTVKTVELKIRYEDFVSESMQSSFPRPTRLDRVVDEALIALLARLYTRRVNLRHLGLTLSGMAPDHGFQPSLFDPEGEIKHVSLQETIDQVRHKFGHQSLIVGKSLNLLGKLEEESYGFVLRTPSLTR